MFKIWKQCTFLSEIKKTLLFLWTSCAVATSDTLSKYEYAPKLTELFQRLWIIHLKDWAHFHLSVHCTVHQSSLFVPVLSHLIPVLLSCQYTVYVTVPNHLSFWDFLTEMWTCLISCLLWCGIYLILPNLILLRDWVIKHLIMSPSHIFLFPSSPPYRFVNVNHQSVLFCYNDLQIFTPISNEM